MKFKIIIAYIALFLLSCKKETGNQDTAIVSPMVVATYNIRVDTPSDIDNAWKSRVYLVTDIIKKYNFDVFGTQEVKDNQLADLSASLPSYYNLGAGRDDGHAGEHSAIFFKKSKYALLNSGDFWLSETPDRPGKGWDAQYSRICTWALLQEKETGGKFYFFNTHLDNVGQQSRTEGLALIRDMIGKIASDTPYVLTGDFNADQTTDLYSGLNNSGLFKDAYSLAQEPDNPKGTTFNNFEPNRNSDSRIDHIFLSPHFKVDAYKVLVDTYSGKFPSDHYPVSAKISLK